MTPNISHLHHVHKRYRLDFLQFLCHTGNPPQEAWFVLCYYASILVAPGGRLAQILLVVCVQYSTKTFKENGWAIHSYVPIHGHELVCRHDLTPSEPGHPRAGNWYYALQLGS